MSRNTNRGATRSMWAMLTTTICIIMFAMTAKAGSSEPTGAKSMDLDAKAYLPVVVNVGTNEFAAPSLLSPDDNAVLQTLIPTLRWDMGQPRPGVSTISCVAWGTSVDELNGCWTSGGGSSGIQQHVTHFNLEPATVYFWRVGFIYDYDYDDIHWSGTRAFTTAPAGGTILPAPTLLSPDNGSAVPEDEISLIWNEVVGAVRYSVIVRNTDTQRGYGWSEYEGTRLNLSSMSWVGIAPGDNYEWSVSVRNEYAWSEESVPWSFSVVPSVNGQRSANAIPWSALTHTQDGTIWAYSQD